MQENNSRGRIVCVREREREGERLRARETERVWETERERERERERVCERENIPETVILPSNRWMFELFLSSYTIQLKNKKNIENDVD